MKFFFTIYNILYYEFKMKIIFNNKLVNYLQYLLNILRYTYMFFEKI